jgi:hypothetical protein
MTAMIFADLIEIDICEHDDGKGVISLTLVRGDGEAFGHIHLENEHALMLYRALGEKIMFLSSGSKSS